MRRALKISAWAIAGLALTALLLGGTVFIAGNIDWGRGMIERLTLRLTSGHVSLTGLSGSFPRRLFLERLQLSDDHGVWLTAEKVSLEWSPGALLARRLQIDTLHAARIDMERLPESSPNAGSGQVSIPHIDAAAVSVDVLKIGAPLAGVPATLMARGSAHLRSVQDMVIDATARRIDGDGDYDLQLRFDPQRMDAALNLHEPAGGPLENLLQLPGLGALKARASLSGPRASERLELSIEAGTFQGTAHGTLNLGDLSADLDFAFDSPALAPRPDLAWERASVRGRWHGSVKAPRADGHIEIDRLRLPGGTQLAALSGDLTADAGKAALHAVIRGLRIPGPRPKLLEDSPVTLDASIRLDAATRPLDLTASHRLFALQASAETAAAGKRTATLELRLPNVGELAALAGQEVRGTALVKARLREEGTATRLTLETGAALRAGTQSWSGVVGDSPTLQLAGALTDSAITLESMKFTGRAATLIASGDLSRAPPGAAKAAPPGLRARWDLNVSDLKAVSPALAGTLKGSGTLTGPMTALAGEAQLNSILSVRGSPSGALSAQVKVRDLPSAPNGSFAAQGMLDGAPVHVEVAMERSQSGSVRALIRRADWKSAHADGDITVATATAQTHGQLRVQMDRLGDLKDLIGIDIGGSLAGSAMLRPERGTTHAQLHFDARDVTAGRFKANAQLSADGVSDALNFKLDLQMPELQGAQASLSAAGALNVDARKIALASAVANYRGQDVRLLSPAQIALANGVSVDVLKVGAQSAVFQLTGEIAPALDMRASLVQVQPTLINAFAPGLLASGTIEAHAQLKGSLSSPTGQVRLTATEMRLADDAAFGLPSLDLQATAQLMGDTANVDARLVAGSASKLKLTGRAPLAAEGALDLKISGSLDVGMINPLLEAHGQHAAGELEVDATVAGSVATPQIDGTVNLTKGSLRDYARGAGLSDITAVVVGSAGTLQIKSFTAAAAPGTVSMTGSVGVLQSGMPVDLRIKAVNAQPLVSKLVTANLDADLHVSGTARGRLDIAGSVHLNRTLIGVPNSLPPNVAVLDVRRRGKAAPPAVPDKPLVIGMDVAVEAPQEFLVQGRGLDAEMGGDLHLSGTTDAPLVSGGFDLQRGSFSLASSRLNFTAGRVSFNGAGLKNKIDPTLDFTAQTTVTDATATLRITGLADAPQFEFTSSPPLPQDEIMARLLFGTNAAQLSALQLAQIGAALASLSGVGGDGGLNPLVKIQKSLGLDRLTVGAGTATNTGTGTENSGASIAAGRYISKRIYVAAKQTTQGTSQLETDVDLTKHLKLQTRLGNGTASVQGTTPENDPGSSVGLTYQFEY
jgi:translocation and assembly module TamB